MAIIWSDYYILSGFLDFCLSDFDYYIYFWLFLAIIGPDFDFLILTLIILAFILYIWIFADYIIYYLPLFWQILPNYIYFCQNIGRLYIILYTMRFLPMPKIITWFWFLTIFFGILFDYFGFFGAIIIYLGKIDLFEIILSDFCPNYIIYRDYYIYDLLVWAIILAHIIWFWLLFIGPNYIRESVYYIIFSANYYIYFLLVIIFAEIIIYYTLLSDFCHCQKYNLYLILTDYIFGNFSNILHLGFQILIFAT